MHINQYIYYEKKEGKKIDTVTDKERQEDEHNLFRRGCMFLVNPFPVCHRHLPCNVSYSAVT